MNETLSAEKVKECLTRDAGMVHFWLGSALRDRGAPPGLVEAMEYSLLAGGKRVRPALCLAAARLFGLENEQVLPYAGALECIHSYSLIHDDLPAMDNDDLRRGKPSNHKVFGEASAILAGDGLLTDAFALMGLCADKGVPAKRLLRAMILAAEAAGSPGMVGGQFLDMLYTGKEGVSLEEIAAMQAMKTGAMLRLACEAGAVLAGADEDAIAALRHYGLSLGAAFQITDDLLDETGDAAVLGKPVGSDAARSKNTYPSLLGQEGSRTEALRHMQEAVQALQPFGGEDAALLRGLAVYVTKRVN